MSDVAASINIIIALSCLCDGKRDGSLKNHNQNIINERNSSENPVHALIIQNSECPHKILVTFIILNEKNVKISIIMGVKFPVSMHVI